LSKRKGLRATISKSLRDSIRPPSSDDTVSNNTKIVLFGLFALVGFAILLYAITATWKYNPEDIDWKEISANNTTAIQQGQRSEEKLQQMEQVNAVYIAAISGSLALGGTLIAQLWGRSK
jgi:hypothetical protein